MTDCIRSLLINSSYLKELFILSNITFNYQTYLKIEKIFWVLLNTENYRKQPNTTENNRILPKTTEYYRKQPNTTENNRILPKTNLS